MNERDSRSSGYRSTNTANQLNIDLLQNSLERIESNYFQSQLQSQKDNILRHKYSHLLG